MAAFGNRRPTCDIDFVARDMDNDAEHVLAAVRRMRPDPEGRRRSRLRSRRSEDGEIRDEDEYSGVRVSMGLSPSWGPITLSIRPSYSLTVSRLQRLPSHPPLLREPAFRVDAGLERVGADAAGEVRAEVARLVALGRKFSDGPETASTCRHPVRLSCNIRATVECL